MVMILGSSFSEVHSYVKGWWGLVLYGCRMVYGDGFFGSIFSTLPLRVDLDQDLEMSWVLRCVGLAGVLNSQFSEGNIEM